MFQYTLEMTRSLEVIGTICSSRRYIWMMSSREQICSLREGIERYVPLYTRFKPCPDALLLWVKDSGPTLNWPVHSLTDVVAT